MSSGGKNSHPAAIRNGLATTAEVLKTAGGCVTAIALLGVVAAVVLFLGVVSSGLHSAARAWFENRGGSLRLPGSDGELIVAHQFVLLPQCFICTAQWGFGILFAIHLVVSTWTKSSNCSLKSLLGISISRRAFTILCGAVGTIAVLDSVVLPPLVGCVLAWNNRQWAYITEPSAFAVLVCLILLVFFALVATWQFMITPTYRATTQLTWVLRSIFSPTLRPVPTKCRKGDIRQKTCDLLLLSDLHLGDFPLVVDGGLVAGEMLQWLNKVVDKSGCKALLIVGDTTDTGVPSQWEAAEDWLGRCKLPRIGIIGNHDVHFRAQAGGARGISFWDACWLPYVGQMSYEESEATASLDVLSSQIPVTSPEGKLWPRLAEFPGLPIDVLLLQSNRRPAGSAATNALGTVGEEQLMDARQLLSDRMRALNDNGISRHLLVCVHHHIMSASGWLAPLLLCLDHRQVLGLALEFNAAGIIHGHMHMPYFYRLYQDHKRITIISCGSTRYPACGPLADKIGGPSCFGISFVNNELEVSLYKFEHTKDEAPANP